MSSKEDGIMIILSSPSGAGKTTLSKILSEKKNFYISISHTTRKPRANEIDGKDYYFVSQDQFNKLVDNDEFIEYAEVFNHCYGTSQSTLIKKLEKGTNIVFDIDWQGTKQIKERKLQYKLITFFILPPSKKVLFDRLSNRDMKDKLIVEERMRQFDKDVLHWRDYDYVVINDNLKNCYEEVSSLIESETKNVKNSYDFRSIEKHVQKLIV